MAGVNEGAAARQRHAGHRPVAHHLEHRLRHAGALPRLQRADRAHRRAVHVRLGLRPRPRQRGAAVRAARADAPSRRSPASSPSAASSRGRRRAHQLAPALRPLRRQQAPHERDDLPAPRGAARGAHARAVRAPRLRRPRLRPSGRDVLAARGRRRVRQGACTCSTPPGTRSGTTRCWSSSRAAGRCCSWPTSPTRPAAFANDQQAGFHNNPVDGVRSIRRVSSGWRRTGTPRSSSPTTWTTFKGYALAPDPFTAGGGA